MTEPGAGPLLSELLSFSTNQNPFNLPSRFLPPAHQPSQLHAHRCSARTYAEHLWRFVEHWRFVLAVHPNDYLVSCPMNHRSGAMICAIYPLDRLPRIAELFWGLLILCVKECMCA